MNKYSFDQIAHDHRDEIIEYGVKEIDFQRSMRWYMFDWGWVIETCHFDMEQTATIETLISYNGETATLIHRRRFGVNCNEMKPYHRDNILPIPSKVRLLPCSEQSSCPTPASAKA